MNDTGIIILAAGSSSRLGRPKQALFYKGRSLIRGIADEASIAGLHPVIIVTGARAAEVSSALTKAEEELRYDVAFLYNKNWQSGMGSGIAAGVSKMLQLNAEVKNVIIAVCDQPFVSAGLFRLLIEKGTETDKGIVGCTYGDTIGTPVLFGQFYFEALLKLDGEGGAKKVLKLYQHDVATIPFPEGSIDIDTEEDYNNLLNRWQ